MAVAPLSSAEVSSRLQGFPDWRLEGGKLRREVVLEDFVAAFAFMTRVAIIAEKMDHHPEWSNVWNRVTLALTTHEAGGITERDFALAEAIDAIPLP